MQPVKNVSVLFKTHLDIGFTDLASTVVRRYMDDYIPAALAFARQTRELPHRFAWTTGSWMAYHFLEAAPAKHRRLMEEAIVAGDFTWHALPFTTHTELLDGPLFRQALRFSQILDRRFGKTTTAAKMTDVPGHTRGIVPLLAEAGVKLLHIGVNPASTVPDVPPVFVWRVDGADLVVIYENHYGGVTRLPGGMALAVNLTNDNLGPQNPGEIDAAYGKLSRRFPGARIHAGTLNGVADHLWAHKKRLPVVTSEIGDTWIHGTGTDPQKIARFRELIRLRNRWIADGRLKEGGEADTRFSEPLLLVAEHTWGLDIKTHVAAWDCYRGAAFAKALGSPAFRKAQASWDEQRGYVDEAVKRLPSPLAKEARHQLDGLQPALPKTGRAWHAVPADRPIAAGPWTFAFDPQNGAIRLLRQEGAPAVATQSHPLARLGYQTFSAADYERFFRQYNILDIDWARKDFTKPGLPAAAVSRRFEPRLKAVTLAPGGDQALAELVFPAEARRVGAPACALLQVSAVENGLDLRLEWFEKAANRMPEALWLGFAPRLAPGSAWRFRKTGGWIDPLDVVRDGNRRLHAVEGLVEAGDFALNSLDAPLVAPGHGSLLDFHNRKPGLASGVSFNLYNNVWGTNFPMWYAQDAVFRFELRIGGR